MGKCLNWNTAWNKFDAYMLYPWSLTQNILTASRPKNKCKNWWKKILRSMRKTSVKYLKFCSICTFFSHKLQRYFEGWDTKGIFKEKSWHTFSSFLYAQFVNGCQNAKKVVAKEGKFYLINATKKLLSSLQLQN